MIINKIEEWSQNKRERESQIKQQEHLELWELGKENERIMTRICKAMANGLWECNYFAKEMAKNFWPDSVRECLNAIDGKRERNRMCMSSNLHWWDQGFHSKRVPRDPKSSIEWVDPVGKSVDRSAVEGSTGYFGECTAVVVFCFWSADFNCHHRKPSSSLGEKEKLDHEGWIRRKVRIGQLNEDKWEEKNHSQENEHVSWERDQKSDGMKRGKKMRKVWRREEGVEKKEIGFFPSFETSEKRKSRGMIPTLFVSSFSLSLSSCLSFYSRIILSWKENKQEVRRISVTGNLSTVQSFLRGNGKEERKKKYGQREKKKLN